MGQHIKAYKIKLGYSKDLGGVYGRIPGGHSLLVVAEDFEGALQIVRDHIAEMNGGYYKNVDVTDWETLHVSDILGLQGTRDTDATQE